MYLTLLGDKILSPITISQFIQKLAYFKYESKLNVLHLIKNPIYKSLLK